MVSDPGWGTGKPPTFFYSACICTLVSSWTVVKIIVLSFRYLQTEYLNNLLLLNYFYLFIDRHLALIFYYFFLYTVLVCRFRPQESQSDVLGDLCRMISLVVGSYFDMPPLLLPGHEPASPGTPTMLTRVRCLSLKPDMDKEVRSHPDSRISAKVQS